MGKKKKDPEKKAAKAAKQQKKAEKSIKKEKKKAAKDDEEVEDIDAILAQLEKEQQEFTQVSDEVCPTPSRRICGTMCSNPKNLNEIVMFG
ncbi:hypothetical protein HDU97_009220, partial [Phlyctochytrium planicorne]